jgi:hypothetical protein
MSHDFTLHQPCTIADLAIGDRFYFASDKKRIPHQVVAYQTKVTKYQTYKYWAKQDGQKHPTSVGANTILRFLRSTEVHE